MRLKISRIAILLVIAKSYFLMIFFKINNFIEFNNVQPYPSLRIETEYYKIP